MSRNPLLVTERKRNEFNNKDAEQDLGRLLRKKKGNASASKELAGSHATSALAAVIKYLEVCVCVCVSCFYLYVITTNFHMVELKN